MCQMGAGNEWGLTLVSPDLCSEFLQKQLQQGPFPSQPWSVKEHLGPGCRGCGDVRKGKNGVTQQAKAVLYQAGLRKFGPRQNNGGAGAGQGTQINSLTSF